MVVSANRLELLQIADAVAREKSIDKSVVLHAMEEAPWADLRGKPLDARGLAVRLKPYGVQSKNLRAPGAVVKGYERADLADAWTRYLSLPPTGSATAATSATDGGAVAAVAHVADARLNRETDAAQSLVHVEAARRSWSDSERAAWLADATTNPEAVIEALNTK